MEHVEKDHDSIKKCEFCHKMYNNFNWHMMKYHKNLFRCSYHKCKTYFRTEKEVQKHMALVHAVSKRKKCIFCSMFYSSVTMHKHLRTVHKTQLASAFKCTSCIYHKYFLNEAKYKNHMDICHGNSLNCIYCDKTWINKKSLKSHVNYVHQNVKIMCNYYGCSQFFHTQRECDAHFKQLHKIEDEKKRFQCPKCSFRTPTKNVLKEHEDRMHETKDISCPKCGKCFGNLVALKQHFSKSHVAIICQHCNSQIVNIRQHQVKRKCENCHLVLLCIQLANLHKQKCVNC